MSGRDDAPLQLQSPLPNSVASAAQEMAVVVVVVVVAVEGAGDTARPASEKSATRGAPPMSLMKKKKH